MKLIQQLKDLREEMTLSSKWQDVQQYLPSWVEKVNLGENTTGCLLDVGCHYGLISVHYIKKTNQNAYGFDVNPRMNALLEKNIYGSVFEGKFIVQGYGLSNENKITRSYSDSKYSGITTIDPEQLTTIKGLTGANLEEDCLVEVKRLDDVPFFEKIAVIKIDCEGSEPDVLMGAVEVIKKNYPIIIFEALTPTKLGDCKKILHELAYEIHPLDERNFIAKKREKE
ncbi:MAG: FkbM family methyltransferase [Candidatus Iainarchaeum archaeon]|uniref:FkbM family methyltransferase n=1 Tax=Candidatus Iainarchaeum sp. TaxID=3101447 RepID=A0A7T9DKT4_9ARCH|nr:MAG: FkbM family methyltransferase [Candidatus Diapherotrites archaeon]